MRRCRQSCGANWPNWGCCRAGRKRRLVVIPAKGQRSWNAEPGPSVRSAEGSKSHAASPRLALDPGSRDGAIASHGWYDSKERRPDVGRCDARPARLESPLLSLFRTRCLRLCMSQKYQKATLVFWPLMPASVCEQRAPRSFDSAAVFVRVIGFRAQYRRQSRDDASSGGCAFRVASGRAHCYD